MDQCILKIFLPRFQFQCEIVMGFAVVALLQWIKDSSIFIFLGLDFGLCT